MDLISKKELLQITGISYGQLYRWKREGIIPEEWFMKQASYTGQETFFPREQILSRIRSILDMKGSHSLEELAVALSPGAESPTLELAVAEELTEEERAAVGTKLQRTALAPTELSFLVALKGACAALAPAELATLAAETLEEPLDGPEYLCTVFSCAGQKHAALTKGSGAVRFSSGVQVIASFYLAAAADFISKKYILK